MSTQAGHTYRRRGAVAVFVLVAVPIILGFAALTVDVGILNTTRAKLQCAADAAALAAAQDLGGADPYLSIDTARATAAEYIRLNPMWNNHPLIFDPLQDIEFGEAHRSPDGLGVVFTPGVVPANAVRLAVHYDRQYAFAQLLGFGGKRVSASAITSIGARDVMFVLDVSCTMGALTNTPEVAADLASLGIPFVDSDSDRDKNRNGDTDDSDSGGGEAKVALCHIPVEGPSNAHTISIAASAVADHLAHGDVLGACVSEPVLCNGNGDSDSD
ncbi:MAG: pilus assembly protein TadG-related protein [Phycisphaerae bacterium]